MRIALVIIGGIAWGWFFACCIWWAIGSAMTRVIQNPLNFWYVWRWKRPYDA